MSFLRNWHACVLPGVILCLACFLAIGLVLFLKQWQARASKYHAASVAFVEQAKQFGLSLEPGGRGTIHVPATDADLLVVLPLFCRRKELSHHFSDKPKEFIEPLLRISKDEQTSPALIWVRDGVVVSVFPARYKVGVRETLQSWKLKGPADIGVMKESKSPNRFLSIYFLADKTEER